ncbi:MAG: glucose-1-phosphate thymidylyltransferase [Epulopiscium sp. Nuni2H_MBin003]|nr:MAG: glucose-1-phosphate thymidylyltransferase [Epulopiscium sp. Nuni2H_MBin003]
MKGIILAGGKGTRLYPMTKVISKQLLPVYDKPMIYYPLSTLMLSNIKEILIISTPRDLSIYKELLGDGRSLGMELSYQVQQEPKGLAEAFIISENFIKDDKVTLILGDNIFYGRGFGGTLKKLAKLKKGAVIFGYQVSNPTEYGVVEFDENLNVLSIEEKPKCPRSKYAIPGLYFYDNDVIEIAKSIQPSKRNELEITSINEVYLQRGKLKIELLERGMAWLDTGTSQGLNEASNFVYTVQKRQGMYIACIEEIAYRNKWIDAEQLEKIAIPMKNTEYGQYMLALI